MKYTNNLVCVSNKSHSWFNALFIPPGTKQNKTFAASVSDNKVLLTGTVVCMVL